MKQEIKELLIILLSITSAVFGIITLALDWNLNNWIGWGLFIVFITLSNLLLVFYYKKKLMLCKIFLIALIVLLLFAIGYVVCFYNDWLKYFESYEAIKELILSFGIWGLLVFFLIQFMQVIIAPIPAMATILAGVAIYGPLVSSFISTFAILIGSYTAFFLGRLFGRKIVVWIAGEAQTKKYSDILNQKGKYLLILMFIFPVFPDDLLCLIAGITSMSFRFFFFATLLSRPLGVLVTAYIGSGHLIPYSGWGLYVWPILIILLVVAFIICWKYQEKIENLFMQKFVSWHQNVNRMKTNKKLKKFTSKYKNGLLLKNENIKITNNKAKIFKYKNKHINRCKSNKH